MKASIILIIVISVLLVGCGGTSSEEKIQTANAGTQAAQPTETSTFEPTPRKTRLPTKTPKATNTYGPTFTLYPSQTPKPTITPTPIPDPILLTGTGDMVVDVVNPFDIAVVRITGNSGGHHFAVINYGSDGEPIDLLVNTTEPYDGYRPLDLGDDVHTTRFEVKAVGDWQIEIFDIRLTPQFHVPGKYEGKGDFVLLIVGEPDIAHVIGNSGGHHFAVIGYGYSTDLFVNTTEPYDGTFIIPKGILLLEIKAVGDWTIEIKSK